jgi:hypothetical protein
VPGVFPRSSKVIAAAITFALAACGSGSSDDTAAPAPSATGATDSTGTAAAEPTPEPTNAPVAVPAALDFSATTIDGSEIELGQFAGRPVLLWFWAPW